MFNRIKEDIAAVRARDPAATGVLEIMLLYPGLHALWRHRIAHWLYARGAKWLARWYSQRTVRRTGIEIHPAAQIGRRVFIDHGAGVVIGETAIVGDDVTLYQGVTLGGTGKQSGKRHPTIGNGVFIGSGAKLLGNFTVGDGAKIAAGAVVLEDVPENATAVGVPARVVRIDGQRTDAADPFDQRHTPDPVAQELCRMEVQIRRLQQRLEQSFEEGGGI
ncbi:MAG: serine O-acetyltransferase [Clostridium sp.]|jgi:serine O-acetyltransferase|nr:serine O-acetyltransferase [Clostridium sp.]